MNWHDTEVIQKLDTYERPRTSRSGIVYIPGRVEKKATIIYGDRVPKPKCKHGHAFTEKNTIDYRGYRICRACRAAYNAKRRAKRKACILD